MSALGLYYGDMLNSWTLAYDGFTSPPELRFFEHFYNRPWRHYHNDDHIVGMLRVLSIDRPKWETMLSADEIAEAVVAIWFHDIICDPGAKDNEEQSVMVFEQFVESDLVKEIILATKHEPD